MRNEELPVAPVEVTNTLIAPSMVHSLLQHLQKPTVHETPAIVQVFIPPSAVQTATATLAAPANATAITAPIVELPPDETLIVLSPPPTTASPIVHQLLSAAQATTIDSIAETAVEITTAMPNRIASQMSNVIQPSIDAAVLLFSDVASNADDDATILPTTTTTTTLMPMHSILLSNVIQTPDDVHGHRQHGSIVPAVVVQQLDIESPFDDIQPSDIVTLPDDLVPPPSHPELLFAVPEAMALKLEQQAENVQPVTPTTVTDKTMETPIQDAAPHDSHDTAEIIALLPPTIAVSSQSSATGTDDLLEMPPPQAILTDDIQQMT